MTEYERQERMEQTLDLMEWALMLLRASILAMICGMIVLFTSSLVFTFVFYALAWVLFILAKLIKRKADNTWPDKEKP